VLLRMDNFLSQPVLYFEGKWVSRREVIKYVAHIVRGVHSGQLKEPVDLLLHKIRQIGSFSSQEGKGIISVRVNRGAFPGNPNIPIEPDRQGVDLVLMQLMAAARYLTISPDVLELAEIVKLEAST
jgi:hypothetical protein